MGVIHRSSKLLAALVILGCLFAVADGYKFRTLSGHPPLVIGHRGACGYRPEHTYGSHELALDMGADVVEVDIVSSKDRSLIIMHENELSITTDVADHPEFQARKKPKVIENIAWTGWFVEDFTLAELKTLRVRMDRARLNRTHDFDNLWQIPTLPEIIRLIRAKENEKGRTIGLYVEIKKPAYFRSLNLSLEEPLMDILSANGYDLQSNSSMNHLLSPPKLLIESFDRRSVQFLSQQLKGVPLTQLIHLPNVAIPGGSDSETFSEMITDEGLKAVRTYATGIGIISALLVPMNERTGGLAMPTDLVYRAHQIGLLVHVWTFRSERPYLNRDYRSPEEEYRTHFSLGIDGAFTDFPDVAFRVRKQMEENTFGDPTQRPKFAATWIALTLLTCLTLLFLSIVWLLQCVRNTDRIEGDVAHTHKRRPLASSLEDDL